MTKVEIFESYIRWRLSLVDAKDQDISDVVMQFERRKKDFDKIVEEERKKNS
jgi:hypothetical protein